MTAATQATSAAPARDLCAYCDGEGTINAPCCEAYDVGDTRWCRCADRRGYRRLRCQECDGEGEIEREEEEE